MREEEKNLQEEEFDLIIVIGRSFKMFRLSGFNPLAKFA